MGHRRRERLRPRPWMSTRSAPTPTARACVPCLSSRPRRQHSRPESVRRKVLRVSLCRRKERCRIRRRATRCRWEMLYEEMGRQFCELFRACCIKRSSAGSIPVFHRVSTLCPSSRSVCAASAEAPKDYCRVQNGAGQSMRRSHADRKAKTSYGVQSTILASTHLTLGPGAAASETLSRDIVGRGERFKAQSYLSLPP